MLFTIALALIIYLPLIIYGGIIYDDWAIYELHSRDLKYFDIVRDWFFGSHYTRPVGSLYISSIGFIFKDKIFLYISSNLILILIATFLISYVIFKKYSFKTALIFNILFLTPNLSSTNIFSSIEQSQGNFANLLFAFGIFFLYMSKINQNNFRFKFISYFFVFISLLTYETVIVLVPFFILINTEFNISEKKLFNRTNIKFIKFLLPILFFCLFVFLYQNLSTQILTKFNLLGGHDVLKFGLNESDFISNIIRYSFKPVIILFYDIPKLYLSSFGDVLNFKTLIESIFLSLIILFILENFKNRKKDNYEKGLNIFVLFILSYILLILIHIAGTSVPNIRGYNNRYFVSFSIIFSLCLSLTYNLFVVKKKSRKIINSFLIFFLILHLNTFLTQRDNFLKVNQIQNTIKLELNKRIKGKKSIVFANVPTYLIGNFSNETIFSTEVNDWPRAVRLWSKDSIYSERIYKDTICSNILEMRENNFYSMRPSRSKKIKNKTKQKLFSRYIQKVELENFEDFYIFKFDENSGTIHRKIDKNNFNSSLKEIFNCKN